MRQRGGFGKASLADIPRNEATFLRVSRRFLRDREILDVQVFALPPPENSASEVRPDLPAEPTGIALSADRQTWERFAREVLGMKEGDL